MVLNSEKYHSVCIRKMAIMKDLHLKMQVLKVNYFFDSHLKIKYIQKIYRKLNALGSISTFLNNDHF